MGSISAPWEQLAAANLNHYGSASNDLHGETLAKAIKGLAAERDGINAGWLQEEYDDSGRPAPALPYVPMPWTCTGRCGDWAGHRAQ